MYSYGTLGLNHVDIRLETTELLEETAEKNRKSAEI